MSLAKGLATYARPRERLNNTVILWVFIMASKLKDESNGEKSEEKPKVCSRDNMEACAEALGRIEDGSESWEELRLIKSMAPRAACIIPASSHDFVSSALLAVGAYALLVDGTFINTIDLVSM